MFFSRREPEMIKPEQALLGRANKMDFATRHKVSGLDMQETPAIDAHVLCLGMGCFWGAERLFWQLPGVTVTAVGYGGGYTPNPSYEEVCSGQTGHTELVRVIYDASKITLLDLLKVFWENHDPTQGMRQGNDRGTQYRSALYLSSDADMQTALASRDSFQKQLDLVGYGPITTEIKTGQTFYFAEAYHQQYLHDHPNGYCGLAGTGAVCPVPLLQSIV